MRLGAFLISARGGGLSEPPPRDERESRWSLGIDIFCPVSTGLGLDIH